jgi:5-methyltetrahydropteroyltriglutamate--homocysteine methyltransferase
MALLTKNTGSYPRIGDSDEHQRLRRAHAQLEKGAITQKDFAAVQDDYTREVIAEQVDAGLDLVTDGQVRWYDVVSHFANVLDGTPVDGLVRFFDTNYLVRQLAVDGPIAWRGPVLDAEYAFAAKHATKPVMPVVTGPFTLAKHTIKGERDAAFDAVFTEIADAVAQEVAAIAAAGADRIQIDEPSVVTFPHEFDLFADGIRAIAERAPNAALELYVYFGDATPIYDRLQALPIDVLGLDFTYSPGLVRKMAADGSAKGIGFGLIDGRNTKLDDELEVLTTIERLVPKISGERIYLNPSCGLEYLPRDRAQRKLKHLVALAAKLT